jgi:hypothetical protein
MVRVTLLVELVELLPLEHADRASAAAPTTAIAATNFLLFNVFLFFEFCCC